MKKRILLAYCMYGNGHRAIAEYIEKYFKEQDQELEIMAIDLLKYSLPILGKASQKATDFFLLRFPMGWSFIYDLFDNKLNSAYATKISLQLFKNKRMRKVITDFDPDLVISTHFYGSSLIDYYNRKGITNCRLITVVTDYETQAMWLKGYKDANKRHDACIQAMAKLMRGRIDAGWGHTAGLRKNGTVVATGDNRDKQCNTANWKNITAIAR